MTKRAIPLGLIVILGLVGALAICNSEKRAAGSGNDHGHAHGQGEACEAHEELGPNGGRLLKDGDFQLELVLFDKGCPVHFRAYPSKAGSAIDAKDVSVSVELERLGDKVSLHRLKAGPVFLFSEETIEQPHSFFMKVSATCANKTYEWEYSQYQGRLTVPSDLTQTIGLETATAGPSTIRSFVELPCEIVFNADRVSHVVPRVAGLAVETRKNQGDPVKQGEVLAIIDSRDLGEARSRFLVALEKERLAKYNFDRSQQLWEKQTVPEKEFITAQNALLQEKIERTAAARKLVTMGLTEEDIAALDSGNYGQLTHFAIKAPFDGVVVKKHLSPGEWVKEDAEIFVVADLTTVWAEIIVYPGDLASVQPGQKAVVKTASPQLEAEGTVSYVEPVMGEESRTAKARVVIPNPDGKWRPGLFGRVHVVLEEKLVQLAVRSEGIQTWRNRPVVFVHHDDRFEARPVELGSSDGNLIEVRKGLEPGEHYATRNSFILKAELGKAGMSHQH